MKSSYIMYITLFRQYMQTDFDQDSKLQTFSSNRTPSLVFTWVNIFRHKKLKRKIQPKANFKRETVTRV